MSHGLPGFDFDARQKKNPRAEKVGKFFVVGVIAAALFLGFAIKAVAKPSDWQYVNYNVIGKPNTPIQMDFRSGVKRGSMSELPFSTLMVNIVFPRQIRTNLGPFPKCKQLTILNYPDECPAKSLVAEGTASSLVRPQGNTSGIIVTNPQLSLKMYVAGKNRVYVRVWSVLSNRLIIPGVIKKSNDKKYSEVLTFTLPRGSASPVPGLISQIEQINLIIKGSYKGNSGLVMSSCPANRKLNFGYWAAYNIDADKIEIGDDPNVLTSEGLVINQVSPLFKRTSSCSK